MEKSPELNKQMSDIFHPIVAKLLYVSKRVCVDIGPTIVFLCMRVSEITQQDWEKLRQLLEYLNCTMKMKRILGSDSLRSMRTYVDVSHATHLDMNGNIGGLVSFRKGGDCNEFIKAQTEYEKFNLDSTC